MHVERLYMQDDTNCGHPDIMKSGEEIIALSSPTAKIK
jgi:hypothetical protein